jgi:prepilin signal peptidase PulO-like enzyme (type II secretory pathway)
MARMRRFAMAGFRTEILMLLPIAWLLGMLANGLADALPASRALLRRPQSAWIAWIRLGRRPRVRELVLEAGVPLLWALALGRFGFFPRGILCALYLTILALVVVTDLERRLIYDAVMLPAIALAILAAPLSPWLEGGAIGAWGVGVGAFIFFFGLAVITQGGIGGGDAMLAAFIGLITGFPRGLQALSWGTLLAGAFALGLLLSRRGTWSTFIPYGPFLALGGALALLG